jgi:oligopeptide/dipeptide ABC transporter ATP-binding protein
MLASCEGLSMRDSVVISVTHLKKYFPVIKGTIFSKVTGYIKAVDDVSFSVKRSETLGLVGESGCGKSTMANMLLGLERPTSGKIRIDGREVTTISGRELFAFRRQVQAVFQDPFRSLNPRKKIKQIISEPMLVHRVGSKAEQMKRVQELLELVGLEAHHAELFPHEFSGGQRQRVAIARALSLNPEVLILDEPVSALDVSIQAQILNLLIDLQKNLSLTYLIISHDLAVVEHVSDCVGVMYLGHLVELALREELYANPMHPYTKGLLDSVPVADPENIKAVALEGEVPSPLNPPVGCGFHPRCSECIPQCRCDVPPVKEITPGHFVCCHLF